MNKPNDFFNDSLEGIGETVPQPKPPSTHTTGELPPWYEAPGQFVTKSTYFDTCTKCNGTGQFRSYSGRAVGQCFACKGKGKFEYKTSPTDRAKAREGAARRKATNEAERVVAFKAEHPAAWAWMEANPNFEFAMSLRNAVAKYGYLTDNQMAAVQRSIDKAAARKAERAERVANAPTVDATKLEQAFDTAREKAQRTGQQGVFVKPLKLQSGDLSLQFSPGSEDSKWAGMIFVKNADGKKLGSIKDGKFTRRFECSDVEEAAVIDACNDPYKAAVAYGKAWSICAVCGRSLFNDNSIERGIGPICAEKYGW